MNDALKAYILAHLKECCEEILEWHNTAILRNGCVREAAKLVPASFDLAALAYVENCVKNEALTYVKNNHTP